MIKAECHSDDRCVEVEFDATPWFVAASDAAILELDQCGWRYDYPADAVVEFMKNQVTEINTMFTYINLRQRLETIGFECSVNEEDAKAWLQINRPSVHAQLSCEKF